MASVRRNPRSGGWEVRYRSMDNCQRIKSGFETKAEAQAHATLNRCMTTSPQPRKAVRPWRP